MIERRHRYVTSSFVGCLPRTRVLKMRHPGSKGVLKLAGVYTQVGRRMRDKSYQLERDKTQSPGWGKTLLRRDPLLEGTTHTHTRTVCGNQAKCKTPAPSMVQGNAWHQGNHKRKRRKVENTEA